MATVLAPARSVARVAACALWGLETALVTVEADVANGLPSFTVVGMPDTAVSEARERVRAAIRNSGFEFPLRRVVVNLAPAERRKEGTGFDLAIALAVLRATGQLTRDADALCLGELALDGTLRPVRGVMPRARRAMEAGVMDVFVSASNVAEAAALGANAFPFGSLREVVEHVERRARVAPSPAPSGGPRRYRRTRDSEARARDRRGRRAQPPAHRTAGNRQDAPGARHRVDPSAPRSGRSDRRERGAQRRGARRSRAPAHERASVPVAASHRVPSRARRWRLAASAGRGQPVAHRRPLPRRARGVLAARAGHAARTARGRRDHDLAGRLGGDISRALRSRRRAESVSVWTRGRPGAPMHLPARCGGAVPRAAVGSAHGPDRSARARPADRVRRATRRGSRGLARRPGARARGPRADARAPSRERSPVQCRDARVGGAAPLPPGSGGRDARGG